MRGSPLSTSASTWGVGVYDGFDGSASRSAYVHEPSRARKKERKRKNGRKKKNASSGSSSPLSLPRSQSFNTLSRRPNTSMGFSRHRGGNDVPLSAIAGRRRPHSRSVDSNRSLSPSLRQSPVPFQKEYTREIMQGAALRSIHDLHRSQLKKERERSGSKFAREALKSSIPCRFRSNRVDFDVSLTEAAMMCEVAQGEQYKCNEERLARCVAVLEQFCSLVSEDVRPGLVSVLGEVKSKCACVQTVWTAYFSLHYLISSLPATAPGSLYSQYFTPEMQHDDARGEEAKVETQLVLEQVPYFTAVENLRDELQVSPAPT